MLSPLHTQDDEENLHDLVTTETFPAFCTWSFDSYCVVGKWVLVQFEQQYRQVLIVPKPKFACYVGPSRIMLSLEDL